MTIHVLGDSHTNVFRDFVVPKYPEFKVASWAFCAHNLYRKGEIADYICCNVKPNDQILWAFGEIDCRIHLFKQWKKQDVSLGKLIDETVENYLKSCWSVTDNEFAIYNVVPAGCWAKETSLPDYAPLPIRILCHTELHAKIELMCQTESVPVIDVWPAVLGDDGCAKREYRTDEVHLNEKIVPFLMEQIKDKLKW
jgi:hypothetical protein